jgi:hypothetical protein
MASSKKVGKKAAQKKPPRIVSDPAEAVGYIGCRSVAMTYPDVVTQDDMSEVS